MSDPAATRELRFEAAAGAGEVSALLLRPTAARHLFVLAHGAGAGMGHRFMEEVASALARAGVATFRYQFPYVERGGRRPDARPLLVSTVRSAVAAAASAAPDLPLIAGGKSMGGRMTSLAAAEGGLPPARGLVFLGFPLHPAGRPGRERADHLRRGPLPMLFLQGTRDALADLALLRPVCEELGASAALRVIEGADHGFHVRKRSGRTDPDVREELAAAIAGWAEGLPPARGG